MSQPALAWPSRLLTLPDWEALEPDDSHHIECTEGVLVVTPKPSPKHQRLSMRLGNLLDAALAPNLTVIPDVEVLLETNPLTLRAPDLIVVTTSDYHASTGRFTKEQVRLAIEIVSPGSRRTDHVTKASEYADAGIPEYWVIDPDTPSLTIHHLHDRAYTHQPAITAATVDVYGTRIDIDLTELMASARPRA